MENLPSDIFDIISQYHDDLQTLSHLTRTNKSLALTLNENAFIWANLSRSLLNRSLLKTSSNKKQKLKVYGKLASLDEIQDDVHALKKFMCGIMMNLKMDHIGKMFSVICRKEPVSTDKYDRILALFRPFGNFDNCDEAITRLFEAVPHMLLRDSAKDNRVIPEQYVIETLHTLFGQYKLLPYGKIHDCLEDSILTDSIEIVRTVLGYIPQPIRNTTMNYLHTCVDGTVSFEMFSLLLDEIPEKVQTHIENIAMFLCMVYPDHGYDILRKYQIDLSNISHDQISKFIRQVPLSDRKKQVLKYFIDNGLVLSEPVNVHARLVTWVIHDSYHMNNDEEILHLLLKNGARVFSPFFHDDPLIYAALYASNRNCAQTVPLLIRFGADVNYRYPYAGSLINSHTGGRHNNYPGAFLEILHMLLEGGANPGKFTQFYTTWSSPLFCVAENASLTAEERATAGRMLIDYGADVRAVSPSGATFQEFASKCYRSDVAQEFNEKMTLYQQSKWQSK